MRIVTDIPLKFNADKVAKKIRVEKLTAEEIIDTATKLINPRAVFNVAYIRDKTDNGVKINEINFTSRILRVNLDKTEKVFPYIITIGEELEKKACSGGDLLYQYYLETIADSALQKIRNYLMEIIKREFSIKKLSVMSPGSLKEWPITEQKPLFSLFEYENEQIKVELTESMLMIPRKSVSGIIFPTEVDFNSCQLCPRENCPGRQAQFNAELENKYR